VELRVGDLQMNAWTWRVYDTVNARRGTCMCAMAMLSVAIWLNLCIITCHQMNRGVGLLLQEHI